MVPSSLSLRDRTLAPERYHQVTKVALVLLCAIVVTGAAVRLSGSGLGCDDWPNCNSERLVDVSTGHAAIEQVNRLFTGAVAAAVAIAVLGARLRTPRRADLEWLAYGLVAGVIAQILLGALLIKVELHPISVQGHFLLSMALVANAVVLVRRSGAADGVEPGIARLRRHRWVLAAVTGIALVTGTVVTGAGPHAGDEDVTRLDFAIPTVARIHSLTVLSAVAVALALALRLRASPALASSATARALSSWVVVALLQGMIGYVQYFADVPPLLVGGHVLGATILWGITVWLVMDDRSTPAL